MTSRNYLWRDLVIYLFGGKEGAEDFLVSIFRIPSGAKGSLQKNGG